jgi:hypothetical protein
VVASLPVGAEGRLVELGSEGSGPVVRSLVLARLALPRAVGRVQFDS